MAKRTITYTAWLKAVLKAPLAEPVPHLCGYPSADVAKKLDVSHQRVSQLVQEGTLDVVEITNAAGRVALTLISEASLERYLDERTPDRNRQGYFAFARS